MSTLLIKISFAVLNEEKLRLEYDFRQRNELAAQQISDLRSELENTQINFNDK